MRFALFCFFFLQAVCEEAVKTGPQVGLFLDAVVFGGEDFRASIGVKDSFLSIYLSPSLSLFCVYVYIFVFALHKRTFTWQYVFANYDDGFSAEWVILLDNLGHLIVLLLSEHDIIISICL